MYMPKVYILLSTYNGEKYLVEQLDSIFDQTYTNFILFVRDDGSTDHTVDILINYKEKRKDILDRLVILNNDQCLNVGWKKSFWKLLVECGDADYYAFSDQDDIWLPNKLKYAVEKLEKEKKNIPVMYFSQYNYCDESLNVLHPAVVPRLPIKFKDVMFYTPAAGFSIVINDKVREIALKTKDYTNLAHDGWVQKIAAAMGEIVYDERSTALYRRHATVVTSNNVNYFSTIIFWIRNEIFGSSMNEVFNFPLQRFWSEYKENISEEDRKLLNIFRGKPSTVGQWAKRVVYPVRFRPSLGGEIALRICLLLNRY